MAATWFRSGRGLATGSVVGALTIGKACPYLVEAAGGARVVPVGYTREMDEYMSASDLIVGKPGGLTTCEALAKGLVFVIVNPIPGQEERNSDHLLENGCAIRSNNPATLGYKIEQLLKDPQKIDAMRSDALKSAKPHAAFEIADTLAAIPASEHC